MLPLLHLRKWKMHALGFRPEKPSVLLLRGSVCRVEHTSEFFCYNLPNSLLRVTPVDCRPSTGQREALSAKNEALPAMDGALSATDALGPHTATEHKQSKMKVFPNVCLYYPPLIISKPQRSDTLGSKTTNQAISLHDGQRSKLYNFNECTNMTQRTITLSYMIKGNGDQGKWHISSLLSMKRPIFLVFELTSDSNTCNATQKMLILASLPIHSLID